MSEALRQEYLQAIGVPLWYSRFRLPGALPTPELDFSGFQAETAPSVANERLATASSVRRPATHVPSQAKGAAIADLTKFRSEMAEGRQAPLKEAVTPGSEPMPLHSAQKAAEKNTVTALLQSAASGETPELNFRLYRMHGFLACCAHHPNIDAHREESLLNSVASALWRENAVVEPLFSFAWPPFTNRSLSGQDADTAGEVLRDLLRPYLEQQPRCVLFGGDALSPVIKADLPGHARQWKAELEPLVSMLTTWSLGEMLTEPRRKKDVWRHLQSFSVEG